MNLTVKEHMDYIQLLIDARNSGLHDAEGPLRNAIILFDRRYIRPPKLEEPEVRPSEKE
ncbi:hypothetical protein TCA2_4586 [Paenibacillus sp. TCA20]|uniref:hypothetical protein n=1 Tax=Paenibacillus sp. TCA20 TaxID=1499968 RepID=UPI0004D7CBD5|nr:hypothetical protein [Paenibacillus sp. TCA20]GAK42094.1 hypothetical protein TCA2_4586 [Paenibacillus sp. TCA20]